jgi:G3E family GTPase
MLEEHRLDRVYNLRAIVTVIDPASFLKLIHTLPNVISQVEACDVALVNKTDLHDETDLREVELEIEKINPLAKILRSTYCRSRIDILGMAPSRRQTEGEYASCRDPRYQSATMTVPTQLDRDLLVAELRRLEGRVYRVKGFVPVLGGTLRVDLATRRLDTQEFTFESRSSGSAPQAGGGRLAFIFPPEAKGLIGDVMAALALRHPGMPPSPQLLANKHSSN